MKQCECGSHAINHNLHGRDGSDPDLCDVCYWRKRARALEVMLRKIVTSGDWYVSSLELEWDVDGEELEREALTLLGSEVSE